MIEKKILAGFLSIAMVLSALGFFFFEKSAMLAGLAALGIIILAWLFLKIYRTTKDQDLLLNEIRELRASVDKRTTQEIENEKIYRALASNIPGSAITILDREERYLLAEGDMLIAMGYNKDNMPGRRISEVIAPENYTWYKVLIDEAFSGKSLLRERRTLSGLDALIRVVPLRNEEGIIYAIMFVLLDVTFVKKVQLELAELNANLEIKIEERTEELRDLNQELEGFTHSVSHDLRAPLRAISGYARILQIEQSEKLDDDGRDLLAKIINNATRMGELIHDLLEFSKLSRTQLSNTSVDMNGLVRDVTQELIAFESHRKLNIVHLHLGEAAGDFNMLRQVWINLISNALKYTRKKDICEIEIRSDREENFIRYSISDNGAGFDMTYADKLFGVFQRLHKPKDFEGTGVGLALVKSIVKRHGGTIWAEAKVDEGAKFYFTLPADIK